MSIMRAKQHYDVVNPAYVAVCPTRKYRRYTSPPPPPVCCHTKLEYICTTSARTKSPLSTNNIWQSLHVATYRS